MPAQKSLLQIFCICAAVAETSDRKVSLVFRHRADLVISLMTQISNTQTHSFHSGKETGGIRPETSRASWFHIQHAGQHRRTPGWRLVE